MKKTFIVGLALIICLALAGVSIAADVSNTKAPTAPAPANQAAGVQGPATPIARPNFAVISGSITKIDTTNPGSPKIEIQNPTDGKLHTIDISPWTNITKVTDISELKQGDAVRVMTRTMDSKEVAMSVIFGKIKPAPAPKPAAQPATPAQPAPESPRTSN